MTWFGWFLIAMQALSTVVYVAYVGKEREPISPLDAVIHLVISSAFIVGIILIGTGHA